jgi:uncharacterized protein (DUF1330 family)
MKKGYWIITFRSVSDPAKLAAYIEIAGPVLAAGGARYVARGMPAKVYEAGVQERTVVIEFESVAKAIAVYESAEYQQSIQALALGAERDVRILEAFE